jgi:pyruvate dehydrogenase E2 component (dihydrolipoamide acetyltransferase)
MTMEIVMPKMGESVSEGTIIKWYKKPGDKVERDEIITEISTDKVDTEIPSPTAGIFKEIKVNEGDTVEVGSLIAVISNNGEPALNENKIESKQPVAQKEKSDVENKTPEPETRSNSDLYDIEMPKMGESVTEGTVIKWYKKVGEPVKQDEILLEISTDKVDTEIPSPIDGTVAEILVGEQETVDVGTVVAKVSTSGKVVQKKKAQEEATDKVEPSVPESMHENFSSRVPDLKESAKDADRFYSPLVLNIAQKESVGFEELANIKGSGVEGRVTKKDILRYIEQRKAGGIKTSTEKTTTVSKETASKFTFDIPVTGEVEKIPMDNIRQKIMQHMVASRDTSVHVTSLTEVDMTKIDQLMKEKREEYRKKEGVKLTYLAFIADACIKALKKYPLVNSSIDGNTIIQKKYVNLGIAVALEPAGLIVPNIKDADQKNILGLASSIHDLANRSRNKKLSPDDITGGTFTITNYGVFGTIFGTPIINQPEVAILGVGAIVKRPVVIEVDGTDAIAIRSIMDITISHDHRLIDGMIGSLFLKQIKETLEGFNPDSM